MSYLPIKIKSTSASILTCREGAEPLLGININLSRGGKTPLNLSCVPAKPRSLGINIFININIHLVFLF